jgi:DNA-directed RNA polymerase subunit omega
MSHLSIDQLEEQVESRYTLVVLAAKRAKQLRDGAPRLIDTKSTNPLTVALEEIAAGKVVSRVPDHDEIPARGLSVEAEALLEIETPEEEAAELIAEAPAPVVDEAARIAELLKIEDEIDEEASEEPEIEAVSREEVPAEEETQPEQIEEQ